MAVNCWQDSRSDPADTEQPEKDKPYKNARNSCRNIHFPVQYLQTVKGCGAIELTDYVYAGGMIMRRKLAVTAVFTAAVLGLSSLAYAGTTLESIGTVDFADEWIDGTNLLAKQDSSGNYTIADMNGTDLSTKAYGRIGYDNGLCRGRDQRDRCCQSEG